MINSGRFLTILFFLSAIFSCSNSDVLAEKNSNPNIIYILADDMGVYDLGCYGQQMIQTPHIDKMAAEGIRFSQHYAGSPVCAPSRGSLMTGVHTGNAYVKGNFAMENEGNLPIPDETVTVAEILQSAGYKTGVIGKWGLGGPNDHGHPNTQGFDYSFCYLDQRLAHDFYPDHLWRNYKKVMLNNNHYSHDLFANDALRFIRQNSEEPFFLYLPFTIPHGKYQVPDDKPYSDKSWPQAEKNYAAMITRMDKDVGEILVLLDSLNLDENTVVFFASDNGGTKRMAPFFNSNGPFKGFKRDAYEGGIRAPLIVRWPGKIAAGRISDHVSAFWDMLPTFAEIAGVSNPENIDGISFLPELLNQSQQEHKFLFWYFFSYNYNWKPGADFPRNQLQNQAVRKGKWKAVRKNLKINPDAPIELYDLSEDIGEENNLAWQYPEIVKEMEQIMKKEYKNSEHFSFN